MDEPPDLGEAKQDKAVIVAKAALGAIPYVGSVVAEVVGTIIPNQRLDRLAEFLHILGEKVRDLDADVREQKMKTEEFIDLFEDGMWQAARAMTTERKEYIASVLKNSLYDGELTRIQEKKLLSLLNELNDAQVIMLKWYDKRYGQEAEEFYELHRDVLQAPAVVIGSSDNEVDKQALNKVYRQDLQRLGLVTPSFEKPKKGEQPKIDEDVK